MIEYNRDTLLMRISNEESMVLHIYPALWFPNTQAKVKLLLKVMRENSSPAELGEVLSWLYRKLDDKNTFEGRENTKKATFCRMLMKNIKQIREFNGLWGE